MGLHQLGARGDPLAIEVQPRHPAMCRQHQEDGAHLSRLHSTATHDPDREAQTLGSEVNRKFVAIGCTIWVLFDLTLLVSIGAVLYWLTSL